MMKMNKQLAVALLATAVAFTSCNDDDDIDDGRFDRSELFATSNTSSAITVYDFAESDEVEVTTLNVTGSNDNEGLFYDDNDDQLIFTSRTNGTVSIIDNVEDLIDGTTQGVTVTQGDSDLSSPRDVAINGDFIVVADNDENELYVYQKTGSTVSLRNTIDVDFALWQIQFDGDDLFVVVDQTNDIAVFNNFLNNNTDGDLEPTKRITIEGITRTHGLAYNEEDDTMILTDIGSAMVDNDGGFHIIRDFTNKFDNVANGGTLAVAGNQVRVAGSATFLGNPVAATYDAETNTIFIAERANAGGRVLAFDAGASGNAAPIINNLLPGASTVFFYGED
jgi:hypothetical protein